MAIQVWLTAGTAKPEWLDEQPTVEAAVAGTRDSWNEEPDGPQAFALLDDAGRQVACLMRDAADPTVCHTLYADGRVECHRCVYLSGPDGRYLRTEVRDLTPRPLNWTVVHDHGTPPLNWTEVDTSVEPCR